MEILVWAGALISVLGLAGILWSLVAAIRARRANLPDDMMRARMQRMVALNLGALFTSIIGLMMVVLGILLA